MSKKVILLSIVTFFIVSCQNRQKPPVSDTEKVTIIVENNAEMNFKDLLIEINREEFPTGIPDSNLSNYILLTGDTLCPFQMDDPDGDHKPDMLSFICSINAGETKEFTFQQNTKEKMPVFKKRTQAELSVKVGGKWQDKRYIGGTFQNITELRVPNEHTDHSFYIRYEGPGWESDKIGYRFYLDWRNAIDIFGKKVDTLVLQYVGQDGFESYHEPANWGMDILKVGESLGIGSIAMWYEGKANRVAQTDSILTKILMNGPIRSMIKTKYFGWKVGETLTDLTSSLSISAGSPVTKHELNLSEEVNNLCTGIVKDENAKLIDRTKDESNWVYIATYGKQSLADDMLGMAVIFRKSDLIEVTEDEFSNVVVLKPENKKLTYYFLAIWEQGPDRISSQEDFISYVNHEADKLNNPLIISFE